MRNFAEWLLARVTDPTRAATIIGDLEELAVTRGRHWFWTAYARTLISLGWRTAPAALLLAIVSGTFLYRIVPAWLLNHRVHSVIHVGLYGRYYPHVWMLAANLTTLMAQGLFFALPFVLIRFGVRNRLTQLAGALFVIALPFYTLNFLLMDLSTICCVLAIAIALLLPLWRRSMIVLAATCIPAVGFHLLYVLWTSRVYHASHALFDWSWKFPALYSIYKMIAFVLAAIVCLNLNRLLLRERPRIA